MEKLQQWQKIKEIVGSALEREPAERDAFLDEACSQDFALRSEVESLLSAYVKSDLSAHPWGPGGSLAAESASIGPYRLIKELGVGGMGQVWLADQTEPVRRQVALKLIKAGMYDASTVQRFKAERQSLAMMDHPAIAKVFDAGATPTGQPYFVMEYVDGRLITDYCDWKKLRVRERLQLFVRVCEGVQHAHQKAIIHRDLKPSNILVVEVDGKPMPRIIDFGLAKVAPPLTAGETLFTQIGAFLGTPGYMSPEQADPQARDVDTRTDVYSLGVVLYELLTGLLPFEAKDGKARRFEDVLRELREDDPPRPSERVRNCEKAAARAVAPKQLIALLRGDLDSITLKAMARDRDQRYATPSALVQDIANHLQSRPVGARPASIRYRARKYVRRHATAVAVVILAAVLLGIFAVMQEIELRRITRERDRADRITEFMTNMFNVSDPSEARGNTITAREILDRSSNEIRTGLARDPELRAQMLHVMGSVYFKLGLYSRAEALFREAFETRRRVLGENQLETLKSADQWALSLEAEARYPEAEKLLRELLRIEQRTLGREDPTTLRTLSDLSWTLDSEGQEEEALRLARDVLQIQERSLGANDQDTLSFMRRLAVVLNSDGHYAESETLFRRTMETSRRTLGPEHPETLTGMGNLGLVLTREGKNAEAESLLRQTLEIQRRILGMGHENTLATINSLGNVLSNEHRYAEAGKLYREGAEAASRSLGREHPHTLALLSNVAGVEQDLGHYREAERLDRKMLAMRQRVLGPDHPDTLIAMFNVADALRNEGRFKEAEKLFLETIQIQNRVEGPQHPDTIASLYNLACTLAQEREEEQALAILARAVDAGLPAEEAAKLDTDEAFKSLRKSPRFLALTILNRNTALTPSSGQTHK